MNMTEWPARVEIREVGPRDGLQNEAPVAVEDRVRLIDALSAPGSAASRRHRSCRRRRSRRWPAPTR